MEISQMKDIFSNPVIMIGNGPFPTSPVPLEIIKTAATRICLDGGADKLLDHGYEPDVVIGDMDSSDPIKRAAWKSIHVLPDQNSSDLEKALNWCINNHIDSLTLLGLTGGRDDQSFVNLLILEKFMNDIDLTLVTDQATVICFTGQRDFKSIPGQTVSILAPWKVDRITTRGLEYQLDGGPFSPGTRGVSNRAVSTSFSVTASHSVWVFRSHPVE